MATRSEKFRKIVERAIKYGWNGAEFADDPSRIWTVAPDLEDYMLSDATHLKSLFYSHDFLLAYMLGTNEAEYEKGAPYHITGIKQEGDPIEYCDKITLGIRVRENIRVDDREQQDVSDPSE